MATVWLIEFQSVSLYFKAMIKGTHILSSRNLKWEAGRGTGSPVRMTCPQSPVHGLSSGTLSNRGLGGGQGLWRCHSYLWVPYSGMCFMPLGGWRRHGKPVTEALGRSCLPLCLFPHHSSLPSGPKVWEYFMVINKSKFIASSIFFPWGLCMNSWGLSASWDHS